MGILTSESDEKLADINYNKLVSRIKRDGVAIIQITEKGQVVDIISNIKSVARWGLGLFYGNRTNQKNFTKSAFLPKIKIPD